MSPAMALPSSPLAKAASAGWNGNQSEKHRGFKSRPCGGLDGIDCFQAMKYPHGIDGVITKRKWRYATQTDRQSVNMQSAYSHTHMVEEASAWTEVCFRQIHYYCINALLLQ